jgi:uncharacterized LabA/DUF88 family protein
MKYIFLVDFDNWFNKKDLNQYTEEEIQYQFSEIINACIEINSALQNTYLEIRLYGGWYQEEILTNKASILFRILSSFNLFPIINNQNVIIRGKIEVIDTLFNVPSYQWRNTLKEKNGMSYIKINNEKLNETCSNNKINCPPHILKRIAKKKTHMCAVEGCNSLNNELFIKTEQKMVDTMIACDLISYSLEDDVYKLVIVSDDVDFFPALAVASQNKIRFKKNCLFEVLIKNSRLESSYKSMLSNFSVNTVCYG